MNAEQIDDLIDAIASDDYERILTYADIVIYDNRTAKEFYSEIDKDKIFKIIMKKIENGDYSHFLSIQDSDNINFIDVVAKLMIHSSKTDDIKKLIEKCQKFDLKDDDVVDLIKATKDFDYIRCFIESKEKRDSLDLLFWSDQIIDLIIATNNTEYIKSFIENIDKRIDNDLLLDEDYLIKLIKATNDPNYIKEFIESNKKRESVGLCFSRVTNLIDLIIATKDGDYIKSFINPENIRIGFTSDEFLDLIEATGDSQYIESIIEDEQKRKELQLSYSSTFGLIEVTHDAEYIKEYIEDGEKRSKLNLKFDSLKAIFLIKCLNDREFTKEFIENKAKRYKSKINLFSSNAVDLIISTKDTEFIKSCIEDKIKREELKLDEDFFNYLRLIEATHDSKYIESYIEDEEKRKGLGIILNKEYTIKLIQATDDPEYIKSFMFDEEKRKKFSLEKDDIITCIEEFSTKNCNEAVKELLQVFGEKYNEYTRKLKIPPKMTVGIEIESEGPHFGLIHRLSKVIDKGWRYTKDSSLSSEGIEVISPILSGDNEKTGNYIRNICKILKTLNQKANYDSAGHVHIGSDYLTNVQSWKNLIEIYGNCEEIFYIISNKSGEFPRGEVTEYAEPISGRMEEELSKGTIQLGSLSDLKNFAKTVQKKNRYFSVNFENIGKSKNTIEFRLANGTLDTDTWIENINLFVGVVKTAEELSKIQEKTKETRTPEEFKRLESFEKIKNADISRQEKVEYLLETIIPEEDRDIYRERYKANSVLFDKRIRLKNSINRYSAKRPIIISTIGRKIFGKENPVSGMDYLVTKKLIENQFEINKINWDKSE